MLRAHILGNTFHAVTLNTRLARAQMAIAHAAILDTRAIRCGVGPRWGSPYLTPGKTASPPLTLISPAVF